MSRDVDAGAEARNAAITVLFQQHAPALLAFLRRQVPTLEDAEDLLLEVFTAAFAQERFFALPDEARRMWLWRVARNKVVDAHRKAERRTALPLDQVVVTALVDEDFLPEHTALRQEEYARLHAAIRRLPPLQQEALRLRFVHNMRCGEIAPRLGKSEKAVRTMLSRTLNLLRSIYGAQAEG